MTKAALRRLVFADPRRVTPELVDEVYQETRGPGSGLAFQAFQRSEVRWRDMRSSYRNRLGELRCPRPARERSGGQARARTLCRSCPTADPPLQTRRHSQLWPLAYARVPGRLPRRRYPVTPRRAIGPHQTSAFHPQPMTRRPAGRSAGGEIPARVDDPEVGELGLVSRQALERLPGIAATSTQLILRELPLLRSSRRSGRCWLNPVWIRAWSCGPRCSTTDHSRSCRP
jgi:hypothetical protein